MDTAPSLRPVYSRWDDCTYIRGAHVRYTHAPPLPTRLLAVFTITDTLTHITERTDETVVCYLPHAYAIR